MLLGSNNNHYRTECFTLLFGSDSIDHARRLIKTVLKLDFFSGVRSIHYITETEFWKACKLFPENEI